MRNMSLSPSQLIHPGRFHHFSGNVAEEGVNKPNPNGDMEADTETKGSRDSDSDGMC